MGLLTNLKLKGRFSSLKQSQSLKKIKLKFSHWKEKVKKKPSIIIIPLCSLIVFGFSSNAFGEDNLNKVKIDNPTCANPRSKSAQLKELGISIIGLKKCFDPCATPLQKALYCSRPCCIVAGFTSAYVAENSPVGSKIHAAATACCIASWNTYGVLLIVNREKTIIKVKD